MPDAPNLLLLSLPSADDTSRLGRALAGLARPGDTILLDGPIGSGKTHLARAFVRARIGRDEDVPSPTFTLVQTYGEGADEIWHADLYRLGHPGDVPELGLDDAFGQAICLIEWPDRLGAHLPPGALRLTFAAKGDGRQVNLAGESWADRLAPLVEALR